MSSQLDDVESKHFVYFPRLAMGGSVNCFSNAVALVIDAENVIEISRGKHVVTLRLKSEADVDTLVNKGVIINGFKLSALRSFTDITRVIIYDVEPTMTDDAVRSIIQKYGLVMSDIMHEIDDYDHTYGHNGSRKISVDVKLFSSTESGKVLKTVILNGELHELKQLTEGNVQQSSTEMECRGHVTSRATKRKFAQNKVMARLCSFRKMTDPNIVFLQTRNAENNVEPNILFLQTRNAENVVDNESETGTQFVSHTRSAENIVDNESETGTQFLSHTRSAENIVDDESETGTQFGPHTRSAENIVEPNILFLQTRSAKNIVDNESETGTQFVSHTRSAENIVEPNILFLQTKSAKNIVDNESETGTQFVSHNEVTSQAQHTPKNFKCSKPRRRRGPRGGGASRSCSKKVVTNPSQIDQTVSEASANDSLSELVPEIVLETASSDSAIPHGVCVSLDNIRYVNQENQNSGDRQKSPSVIVEKLQCASQAEISSTEQEQFCPEKTAFISHNFILTADVLKNIFDAIQHNPSVVDYVHSILPDKKEETMKNFKEQLMQWIQQNKNKTENDTIAILLNILS